MTYLKTLVIFLCLSIATQSLAHTPPPAGPDTNQQGLIDISIQMATKVAADIATDISRTMNSAINDKALWQCLNQCSNGFEDAIRRLDISMAAMDVKAIIETISWLNTTTGDIVTCDKGCKEVEGEVKEQIIQKLENFRMQCGVTLNLAKTLG